MKIFKILSWISGFFLAAFTFGFIYQLPFAIQTWPWSVSPLTYLFIGSILAAVCASLFWILLTEEFGAMPGGMLNVFGIALTTTIYFFSLTINDDRVVFLPYALVGILMMLLSAAAFLRGRRIPLKDPRPTPGFVLFSFWVFLVALTLASVALIFRLPIFPWPLTPESSIVFGCIFLGDALFFVYGLLHPRWHNAAGQLLSFLAYDLVLIFPFLRLFGTIEPQFKLSLIIYVAVLIYSGFVAIYYLFIYKDTRIWKSSRAAA